jgi:hypothetical protein
MPNLKGLSVPADLAGFQAFLHGRIDHGSQFRHFLATYPSS